MSERDVTAYLERIGFDAPVRHDLDTLAALQIAHLQAVPFEALEVFCGRPVVADDDWAWNKVVERGRGGWCFEANGAFAVLLGELGFEVRRLGAAVLLGGPNVLVDHLVLEVQLDEAYLVEVGFGRDGAEHFEDRGARVGDLGHSSSGVSRWRAMAVRNSPPTWPSLAR